MQIPPISANPSPMADTRSGSAKTNPRPVANTDSVDISFLKEAQSSISNAPEVGSQNLSAAFPDIENPAEADKSMDFLRNSFSTQPGSAMLAQAHLNPDTVFSLLQE